MRPSTQLDIGSNDDLPKCYAIQYVHEMSDGHNIWNGDQIFFVLPVEHTRA